MTRESLRYNRLLLILLAFTFAIATSMVVGGPLLRSYLDETGSISAMPLFDMSYDQKLVDYSSDVFIGRVSRQVGKRGLPATGSYSLPQTQFTVQVEELIKGTASEEIVVNQMGGIESTSRKLVLFEGQSLLKSDERVLLFTRYDQVNDWYNVVAIDEGERRVTNQRERATLVKRFKAAAEAGPEGPVEAWTLLDPPDAAARETDSSGRPAKCDHAAWERTMPEQPDPECYYPRPRR